MTPRQRATEELLYIIDRFDVGAHNREAYEKRLGAMSDAEFETFITNLESEEEILALWSPNLADEKLQMRNLLKLGDELGHDFWHHLRLTDPTTGQVKVTPVKFMVVDMMLRRQAQMLYKKKSIPDHNKSVDERSGQATADSKGASMSYPELMVNAAKGGLDDWLVELIKFRGGDERAFNAMNRSIVETGGASLDAITAKGPSTVKANDTLSTLLKSMGLDNNL